MSQRKDPTDEKPQNNSKSFYVKEQKDKTTRLTPEEVALEKIAYDLYELCGVAVPKTYILKQDNGSGEGVYSLASKFETGYRDLDHYLNVENKTIEQLNIEGLDDLQVASAFLYDSDVIGRGFNNIGLIKTDDDTYRVMKIDPGAAELFFNPVYDGSEYIVEEYNSELLNTGEQNHHYKDVFQVVDTTKKLRAIERIINIDEKDIRSIVSFERIPQEMLSPEKREKIIANLMERQNELRKAYSEQLKELNNDAPLERTSKKTAEAKNKYAQKNVVLPKSRFFPTGMKSSNSTSQPERYVKKNIPEKDQDQAALFLQAIRSKQYIDAFIISAAILTELHIEADKYNHSERSRNAFIIESLTSRFSEWDIKETDIKAVEVFASAITQLRKDNPDDSVYGANEKLYEAIAGAYNKQQQILNVQSGMVTIKALSSNIEPDNWDKIRPLVGMLYAQYQATDIEESGFLDHQIYYALKNLELKFPDLSPEERHKMRTEISNGIISAAGILNKSVERLEQIRAAYRKFSILRSMKEYLKEEEKKAQKNQETINILTNLIQNGYEVYFLDREALNLFAKKLYEQFNKSSDEGLKKLLEDSLAKLLMVDKKEIPSKMEEVEASINREKFQPSPNKIKNESLTEATPLEENGLADPLVVDKKDVLGKMEEVEGSVKNENVTEIPLEQVKDPYLNDYLLPQLEKLSDDYKSLKRTRHVNDIDKLIDAIKAIEKNETIDDGVKLTLILKKIEIAFSEQEESFKKSFLGITKRKTPEEFIARLNKSDKDYHYPRLLAVTLQGIYLKYPEYSGFSSEKRNLISQIKLADHDVYAGKINSLLEKQDITFLSQYHEKEVQISRLFAEVNLKISVTQIYRLYSNQDKEPEVMKKMLGPSLMKLGLSNNQIDIFVTNFNSDVRNKLFKELSQKRRNKGISLEESTNIVIRLSTINEALKKFHNEMAELKEMKTQNTNHLEKHAYQSQS